MVAEHGEMLPQEQIPEMICEQIWNVQLPQVVEQVLAGPMIPSRDRILQGTVEQISDVLVPDMVEQLVMVKQLMKLPKTASSSEPWSASWTFQFRRMWRNWWRSLRIFPKGRIQQRFVEQTDENSPIFPSVRRSSMGLSLRRNRV